MCRLLLISLLIPVSSFAIVDPGLTDRPPLGGVPPQGCNGISCGSPGISNPIPPIARPDDQVRNLPEIFDGREGVGCDSEEAFPVDVESTSRPGRPLAGLQLSMRRAIAEANTICAQSMDSDGFVRARFVGMDVSTTPANSSSDEAVFATSRGGAFVTNGQAFFCCEEARSGKRSDDFRGQAKVRAGESGAGSSDARR